MKESFHPFQTHIHQKIIEKRKAVPAAMNTIIAANSAWDYRFS